MSGRSGVGTIRFLVNGRGLQLKAARVLREPLLMLILIHGSEKIIWKEKRRSRIRAVSDRQPQRVPVYQENG